MPATVEFPSVPARDLEGLEVRLPEPFSGERNVVIVAFRRNHQSLVDSWVPWLDQRSAGDPGLRYFELPTIARMWAPARNVIDGGMAAAIGDPVVLRRTLTVYGDVSRLTGPLGLVDRSTIALVLVDGHGLVQWSGTGGFDAETADALAGALEALGGP